MNIPEINRRILELKERVAKKPKVRLGNRVKKISSSLKSYVNGEIEKLEKIKGNLLQQQSTERSLIVTWDKINFEDNSITISDGRHYYTFITTLSKKSYNYIKPFLLRLNLPPIIITIANGQILDIKNQTEFEKGFEFIKLENLIYEIPQVYEEEKFITLSRKGISLSNSEITNAYKLKFKNQYFKFLCEIQDEKFKLIPVAESTFHSNGHLIFEEGFLFTIKSKKDYILIWENINTSRATYIFKIMEKDYYLSVYQILLYLLKESLNKRLTLKRNKKVAFSNFQAFATINHESIEDWSMKIQNFA